MEFKKSVAWRQIFIELRRESVAGRQIFIEIRRKSVAGRLIFISNLSKTEPMEFGDLWRFWRSLRRVLMPELIQNISEQRANADFDIGLEMCESQNQQATQF